VVKTRKKMPESLKKEKEERTGKKRRKAQDFKP